MIQQAMQKIQAEIAEKPNDKYVQVVGGFLINHVRSNPQDAELIMTDGKTIAGSLNAMREEARKHQSGGVGVLTDEEGFAIVLKYFGVNVSEKKQDPAADFNVSLEDLL